EGLPVLGQKGPIYVHGHNFGVSGDGTVMVDGFQVDKLRLAGFSSSSPFETCTGTLFFKKDPHTREQPAQGIIVRQGQLELSNVNIMKEMTRLIEISAHYESCQKMIQTIDEMDQKVINETGRI
ncbi:MAG: flagellar basal body rod C-terminal domain-containing protein, partial [bacterium]